MKSSHPLFLLGSSHLPIIALVHLTVGLLASGNSLVHLNMHYTFSVLCFLFAFGDGVVSVLERTDWFFGPANRHFSAAFFLFLSASFTATAPPTATPAKQQQKIQRDIPNV